MCAGLRSQGFEFLIKHSNYDNLESVNPELNCICHDQLGGIYESKGKNVGVGFPGLSSITLIGRVFQSSQRRAFKSELLIFTAHRFL